MAARVVNLFRLVAESNMFSSSELGDVGGGGGLLLSVERGGVAGHAIGLGVFELLPDIMFAFDVKIVLPTKVVDA